MILPSAHSAVKESYKNRPKVGRVLYYYIILLHYYMAQQSYVCRGTIWIGGLGAQAPPMVIGLLAI